MSVSKRNSPFANAGFVVGIGEKEWTNYRCENEFAGLKLRMALEKLAFELGGHSQIAPAQKAADFLKGKTSATP